MSAPDWLPELTADLGATAAQRFISRAAGMRVYVPSPGKAGASTLRALGGMAVAEWFAARYAGDYIDVPSGRAAQRDSLRQAVRAEPEAPVNELAHRFGVTSRRVLQLRAEISSQGHEEPGLLARMRSASSDNRKR